jgi:hypothetical protein
LYLSFATTLLYSDPWFWRSGWRILHRQSPYTCGETDREQINYHPPLESHEP